MSSLLLLAVATAVGWPVATTVTRPGARTARIGAALLLGIGITSSAMLLLAATTVGFRSYLLVISVSAGLSGLLRIALRREITKPVPQRETRPTIADVALMGSVAAHAIFASNPDLWSWTNWNPSRRDFFFIWGARANLFFHDRTIDFRWLASSPVDVTHSDYPPLVPLLMAQKALIEGRWDTAWLGILFTAIGAAAIILVRGLFREEGLSGLAAAASALALSPFLLTRTVGLADGVLTAYSGVGILLMRNAVKSARSDQALLGAFALGFGAMTKNEGLVIAILALGAAYLLSPRIFRWRDLLLFVLLAVPWPMARVLSGIQSDAVPGGFPEFAAVLSRAVEALRSITVAYGDLHWLWLGLVVVMAMSILEVARERRREDLYVLMVLASMFGAYLLAYAISPHEVSWNVIGTWGRLSGHFALPFGFVALRYLSASRSGSPLGTVQATEIGHDTQTGRL